MVYLRLIWIWSKQGQVSSLYEIQGKIFRKIGHVLFIVVKKLPFSQEPLLWLCEGFEGEILERDRFLVAGLCSVMGDLGLGSLVGLEAVGQVAGFG